jgi:hypothetical protein
VTRPCLAVAVAALALASCGGSDVEPPSVGGGSNAVEPGSLGKLTCGDWNRGSLHTRGAIVEELRLFSGGPVTGEGVKGTGAVLEDEQAYELFERRCEGAYAEHFLLFKLYTHAAGFAGGAPGG